MAAVAPAVPIIKGAQESIEQILESLRVFFTLTRAREDAYIVKTLTGKVSQQEILDAIADETARSAMFARRVTERVRRDIAKALNLETQEKRDRAIAAVLRREKVYAGQRSEAMAVRALSTLDRAHLKETSPAGAFWHLDPNVKQHTPDCLAMGGKFWPWEALAVIFPPTHSGCRCRLGAAREGDRVEDVARAVRQAQAAKALLHEGEERDMIEAIVEHGLADAPSAIRAYMAAVS